MDHDTVPDGHGVCPLCLETRCTMGPDDRWSCPSCQLQGLDLAQRHAPLPASLIRSFDRDSLELRNPYGWRNKLGLEREASMRLGDFIVPPPTALMLSEALQRNIIAIKTSPFIRWDHAARYRLVSQPLSQDVGQPSGNDRLTIGGICRAGDAQLVASLIDSCRHLTRHYAFVVDAGGDTTAADFRAALDTVTEKAGRSLDGLDIRILVHALNNDFGSQRNRVQDLATTDWVLQLDTDERLSADFATGLELALARAEKTGMRSIGFARANYVDGLLSALWPDVQFRLNRREVRYLGTVHETPGVHWRRQSWSLVGHILHSLPKVRLAQRQERYEGIRKGGGKPADTAQLETPFPDVFKEDDPFFNLRPARHPSLQGQGT